ncbi:protein kintoun-like [Daktulosphaira vitifoliae]|uniref:protein kintoun-like n=1 Tax=Daktulosphaira vitifoliae TaxID=58002 RepID=UPI0021AA3D8A|nr:protein kintoun-like [Daktulosphaira vitifoliae]
MGNLFSFESINLERSKQIKPDDSETCDISNKEKNNLGYERDVINQEMDQDCPQLLVQPIPVFVIKTHLNDINAKSHLKVFINVCYSNEIGKASCSSDINKNDWCIPNCISPRRYVSDSKNNLNCIIDVVFHTDFVLSTVLNNDFKDFVKDAALKSIENSYNIVLDRDFVKYSKKSVFGVVEPIKIEPLNNVSSFISDLQDSSTQTLDLADLETSSFITPSYTIKYRSGANILDVNDDELLNSMPTLNLNEIIIEIDLPLLEDSKNIVLTILKNVLKLVSTSSACYKLNINIPSFVSVDNATGVFDTDEKRLTVCLPVLIATSFINDVKTKGVIDDVGKEPTLENTEDNYNGTCNFESLVTSTSDKLLFNNTNGENMNSFVVTTDCKANNVSNDEICLHKTNMKFTENITLPSENNSEKVTDKNAESEIRSIVSVESNTIELLLNNTECHETNLHDVTESNYKENNVSNDIHHSKTDMKYAVSGTLLFNRKSKKLFYKNAKSKVQYIPSAVYYNTVNKRGVLKKNTADCKINSSDNINNNRFYDSNQKKSVRFNEYAVVKEFNGNLSLTRQVKNYQWHREFKRWTKY